MNPSDNQPVSLYIEAVSEDALSTWAIKFLHDRGYSVQPAHEQWETITAFLKRLGIHSQTLNRALAQPHHPNVLIHRGKRNRIIEILSNPDFDAFLLRNKKGGAP